MAVVAVTKQSPTPPKQDSGHLTMVACLSVVLLAAVVISGRGSAPLSATSDEPLVLAYEYCGHHLEVFVEVGRDFHVSTAFGDVILIVEGRIHSVFGDTCRLTFKVGDRSKSGGTDEMAGSDLALKIGGLSGGIYGAHGSPCTLEGPCIRRGIDPIPSLVQWLRPDYEDFAKATTELRKHGAAGAGAIPRLIEGLQGRIRAPVRASYELPVQGLSAMALGDIGPAASAAVPALLEALNDENPQTRIAVASALWKIGRHAARFALHLGQ